MSKGYVYVLTSPACDLVKIGGTDHPPMKRLREINATEPYRSVGPWSLADFREVVDWRAVEYDMHYAFRSKLAKQPTGQKELFRIAPGLARTRLEALDPSRLIRKPQVDRMFQDEVFLAFLMRLFSTTGILNWLNIQGAWTFSLFPGTGYGRYYTINIGPHEVAFATLPEPESDMPYHCLVMDRLIGDYPAILRWVEQRDGLVRSDVYASALPRSVSVSFSASFEDACEFLALDGVRRAMLAYWSEGLTVLKELGRSSLYARHHNWNAVAALWRRIATTT